MTEDVYTHREIQNLKEEMEVMNISRPGNHQYSFEIHQCMSEIHLPFAMRHDTQSGASMSMTRACACAFAHH